MTKYFHLQQQNILLEALKDIDAAQTESIHNILILEYKKILENECEIRLLLNQRPFYLERLQSIFDKYLKNINIKLYDLILVNCFQMLS